MYLIKADKDRVTVLKKLREDDKMCTVVVQGEVVSGERTKICNGEIPPTKEEREEEIRYIRDGQQ